MKILKSKQFISERMKIIPITNDEFDKVKEYKEYCTFTEIENPSYDDMLVPGNVVITSDFGSKKTLWVCIGNKDMKRIGINRDDADFAVVRKINSRRISWNDVEGWHEKFPNHRMFGTGMSVIYIYKTDINVSLMNEENFEKIYYKIVEQYKNKYPDTNIVIDK